MIFWIKGNRQFHPIRHTMTGATILNAKRRYQDAVAERKTNICSYGFHGYAETMTSR